MAAVPTLKNFVVDVAERTVFTFVATFVGLYTPVLLSLSTGADWHSLLNLSFAQKAVVAALAATFTVLKSAAGSFVGNAGTPGFVPNWVLRALQVENQS